MLFGKNSDRQRNEAQAVERHSRAEHPLGSQVRCSFITIPQVPSTHAILICRPFWIWGAEMGANEHGVVIGNEGLIARSPSPEKNALTGMDLVRLALERACTAAQAAEVITTLLEKYGQGGNCGHLNPSYYNNGFVIADSSEAFVLETIERDWVLERVSDVRTASNVYSIERGAERVSAGLKRLILDSGWSTDTEPNFAAALQNIHTNHIATAGERRKYSTSLLASRNGQLRATDMMAVLRDHGSLRNCSPNWRAECLTERTVCMHAGAADCTAQTVGSMVSELRSGESVHWVTGTSAPCTAIFKPLFIDVSVPMHGGALTDRFDPQTLWWRHERLYRAALLGGLEEFISKIRPERDSIEERFHARIMDVMSGGSNADRAQVVTSCWKEAIEAEDAWYAQMNARPLPREVTQLAEWVRMSELCGLVL